MKGCIGETVIRRTGIHPGQNRATHIYCWCAISYPVAGSIVEGFGEWLHKELSVSRCLSVNI